MTSTISKPVPATSATEVRLRRVLLADAALGLVTAVSLAGGHALYVELTALPGEVLLTGAGLLLVYVAALIFAGVRRPLARGVVRGIIVANALWVIASAAVLLVTTPSVFGIAYVVGQAAIVAVLAIAEGLLLRRLPH